MSAVRTHGCEVLVAYPRVNFKLRTGDLDRSSRIHRLHPSVLPARPTKVSRTHRSVPPSGTNWAIARSIGPALDDLRPSCSSIKDEAVRPATTRADFPRFFRPIRGGNGEVDIAIA